MCKVKAQGWEHSQIKGVYDEVIMKSRRPFWECPFITTKGIPIHRVISLDFE
jgi:hypothetical protein